MHVTMIKCSSLHVLVGSNPPNLEVPTPILRVEADPERVHDLPQTDDLVHLAKPPNSTDFSLRVDQRYPLLNLNLNLNLNLSFRILSPVCAFRYW